MITEVQKMVRQALEIWLLLLENYWIGLFKKHGIHPRHCGVVFDGGAFFTSSHPKTESKLIDIKNELDNWSWLYEHYWSCMILMNNDHSWSLIMLIMYEICWSCYDTLLIMHDICWSCYERLLIMHEICWSCYERLLIIHDDQWSLPWKTVDHSWSTLIGVSYRDHYILANGTLLLCRWQFATSALPTTSTRRTRPQSGMRSIGVMFCHNNCFVT